MSVEELLLLARAGNEGALEELFERCRPTLGKWASRELSEARPGVVRPSDITQETALRAFTRFSSFKGTTEGEWFAWLKRIFQSRTAQSARSARRQKREETRAVPLDSLEALTTPSPQKSPSQATSYQEEWRQLLAALFHLPDDQREAIWLCHLKELPVAEAARYLGRTEQSVAGLLQRGLKALRTRRKQESEADPGEPTGGASTLDAAAEALLAYLQRRDAGKRVEPEVFIAEYPACAEELRAMLQWIERLQALRPSAPSP